NADAHRSRPAPAPWADPGAPRPRPYARPPPAPAPARQNEPPRRSCPGWCRQTGISSSLVHVGGECAPGKQGQIMAARNLDARQPQQVVAGSCATAIGGGGGDETGVAGGGHDALVQI